MNKSQNKYPNLELLHRLVSLTPEDHDFQIITDGSGAEDGYGGTSAIVFSDKYNIFETIVSCRTHTTTDRAELNGLLIALETILHVMGGSKIMKQLREVPFTAHWATDQNTLVGCMQRNNYGETLFRRRANLDMWHMVDWYDQFFVINAEHRERQSNSWHDEADKLASSGRIIIRDYMENGSLNQDLELS